MVDLDKIKVAVKLLKEMGLEIESFSCNMRTKQELLQAAHDSTIFRSYGMRGDDLPKHPFTLCGITLNVHNGS